MAWKIFDKLKYDATSPTSVRASKPINEDLSIRPSTDTDITYHNYNVRALMYPASNTTYTLINGSKIEFNTDGSIEFKLSNGSRLGIHYPISGVSECYIVMGINEDTFTGTIYVSNFSPQFNYWRNSLLTINSSGAYTFLLGVDDPPVTAPNLFIGDSTGVARQIQNAYIGVNGVAKKVNGIYIGNANGVARKI